LKNLGRRRSGVMGNNLPLLRGFLRKLVLDVMPATLASAIGGLVFTHYGLSRAPEPVAAHVAPASPEMMQLLRDEHGLIANYLKAKAASEKERLAAEDAEARAAAANAAAPHEAPAAAVDAATPHEARAVAVDAAMPQPAAIPRQPVVAATAKPAQPQSKPPAAGASPSVVIAQTPPRDAVKADGENPDSLPAKVGIKDHVVAVAQSVVSAIGGIPSWIGSIGDRIGGEDPSPRPRVDVANAAS
jgi:hypothetical protein